MNQLFLENIKNQVAFYLDKLKLGNPLFYLFIQMVNASLLAAFYLDKINLNTEMDNTIIAVLFTLSTILSPRTSARAEIVKDSKNAYFYESKVIAIPEDIELPLIDQSNT